MHNVMDADALVTDERCPLCDCEVVLVALEGGGFEAECSCGCTSVLA